MEFDTFETKMAKSDEYRSVTGKPELELYEYRVDKYGVKNLVKSGKTENVQARIDADYDSSDINKLMLRFSLGDTSAIDVRQGMYIDATDMPSTYAELFDRVEQAKEYFFSLPTDLKEMFNNSVEQFFSEMNTKGFNEKIDKYNDRFVNHQFDENPIKDEGVKEIEYNE